MNGHAQFAEDLALHALGGLTGEERAILEKHLASCAACARELEQLRGDGALLALSTMGPKPPQRARQRLLDAVARETTVPKESQRLGMQLRLGHGGGRGGEHWDGPQRWLCWCSRRPYGRRTPR